MKNLKNKLLKRADLLRLNEDNITRSIISFDLGKLLDSPNSDLDINLKANDIVRVYRKDIFINNTPVSIYGVVRNPGIYNLKSDMTLKDLILEAGGLDDNVYRYKVEIARVDPMNKNIDEYAKSIIFEMNEKFSLSSLDSYFNSKNQSSGHFLLNPYDLVSVRPDPLLIIKIR